MKPKTRALPNRFWGAFFNGVSLCFMSVAVAVCLRMLPKHPEPFPLEQLPHLIVVGWLMGVSVGKIVPQTDNGPNIARFIYLYCLILLAGSLLCIAATALTK